MTWLRKEGREGREGRESSALQVLGRKAKETEELLSAVIGKSPDTIQTPQLLAIAAKMKKQLCRINCVDWFIPLCGINWFVPLCGGKLIWLVYPTVWDKMVYPTLWDKLLWLVCLTLLYKLLWLPLAGLSNFVG